MRRNIQILILLGLVLLVTGCSPRRPSVSNTWYQVGESELSAEQIEQSHRAIAARDTLFERLMSRLATVIQEKGPAAAVAVCQAEAPAIAETVAAERGVRIGRTSERLRNPNNRPPDWAVDVLATRPESPTFLVGPNGQLGALLPIRLKTQCLTCHGLPDQIPAPVREALMVHYPQDKAVGYKEGDLRGWFWIEVPPTSK